jgi:formiminotetrahydrofolate cyclodeaminase
VTERQATSLHRIDVWLDGLASNAPTPGGGAFAALSAAAGSALIAMTARLTIGKKGFEEVHSRMQEIAQECDASRRDLLELADRDADAFDAVMAAYRMPKETDDERSQRLRALQAALEGAAEVPLSVARRAVYLMSMAGEVAEAGNPNAASDALSAAAALHAATVSALANVEINAFAFVDASRRGALTEDVDRLRDRSTALLREVAEAFGDRVRAGS